MTVTWPLLTLLLTPALARPLAHESVCQTVMAGWHCRPFVNACCADAAATAAGEMAVRTYRVGEGASPQLHLQRLRVRPCLLRKQAIPGCQYTDSMRCFSIKGPDERPSRAG